MWNDLVKDKYDITLADQYHELELILLSMIITITMCSLKSEKILLFVYFC